MMKKPVVIVDPLSSGIELAPAFKARGIPAIAVTLTNKEWPEFGSKIKASDFVEMIPEQPGIEILLKKYDPIAFIPGTEEGIPLAERLTLILMPQLANDPEKSLHRSHKSFMQKALQEAGVPFLKTLHTASEQEVQEWIKKNDLENSPLIIKPPMSSGSEMVFHIAAFGDWKKAFHQILTETSIISGRKSETVVIQEQAIGTEYAVGTVSANGKHYLVHLIKYNKTTSGERRTVFDHVEFVSYDKEILGDLFEYTQKVLDALGVRFGPAHTEIMLTKNGPRLIESSARMIGGPVVELAREATGSSQADKLVEIYVDGDVHSKEYRFKKTVVPVFLKAVNQGIASNLEVLDGAFQLSTLLYKFVWINNGDHVPQTVDYLTGIGIIALTGDRESIFLDYKKIRAMESKLVFTPQLLQIRTSTSQISQTFQTLGKSVKRHVSLVGGLAVGMFAMGCEDFLFAGLLPGISTSLHAKIVPVAQGCSLFGLAYVLSVPLCAFLLSRNSARHVLITALILFIAGNVVTLLSTNLMIYILSRFLAGLGGGLFLPVAVAAGTQAVDPGFRGRALSVMWSFNSAGAVVGVPLGLWLADRMGWRVAVFLILILATLALVAIVIRKQTLQIKASPPSLGEQFRMMLNPRVHAVIGVTFLTATGCLGFYSYISQVLSGTEKSPEVAFSLWSAGGLIGIIGIGYVVDRIGKPQVVMMMIIAILLFSITAIPVLNQVPVLGLLPFLVCGAMGWASVAPQQYSLLKNRFINAKTDHEAILVALNSSAVSLGSVVGTALGGLALSSGLGAQNLSYAAAGLLLCAFIWQVLLLQRNDS